MTSTSDIEKRLTTIEKRLSNLEKARLSLNVEIDIIHNVIEEFLFVNICSGKISLTDARQYLTEVRSNIEKDLITFLSNMIKDFEDDKASFDKEVQRLNGAYPVR